MTKEKEVDLVTRIVSIMVIRKRKIHLPGSFHEGGGGKSGNYHIFWAPRRSQEKGNAIKREKKEGWCVVPPLKEGQGGQFRLFAAGSKGGGKGMKKKSSNQKIPTQRERCWFLSLCGKAQKRGKGGDKLLCPPRGEKRKEAHTMHYHGLVANPEKEKKKERESCLPKLSPSVEMKEEERSSSELFPLPARLW